jgi:hypothetical protein
MKPISNTGNNLPASSNCIKTPSTCVIWNGPDIPCINVCNGDTIDVIVYQLATLLCDITENVLDVTTLDFECLVASGECPPETLIETLQLIITKVCNPDPSPDPCPPDSGLPIVQLPPCLYYTNSENDQVTALPLDQYAQYLASTICQIIADINSINATLTSINNRLTVLELSGSGGSGGGTPISTIIAGCYSGTPGTPVTIPTALVNLESKICEYNALLGTLTEWNDLINSTCITGSTPLPCGTGTYGSIPGWITNVETAADSLKNLWIAVCKLNECLSAAPPSEGCATIPPTNVTVAAVTNTTCTINWTAPVTIGLTPPSGYKIQIFNAAGTGSAIANYTIAGNVTSYVLPTPTLTVDTQYTVKVIAVYGCGDSQAASIVAVLKAPLYFAKVHFVETIGSSTPSICTPTNGNPPTAYNNVVNQIKIELKDLSGNLVANANAQAIKVVVRIKTIGCDGVITTNNQNITIAPGASSGLSLYTSAEKALCPDGSCQDIIRNVECYVSATLNDGSPLPSTIGLDTSLTSLGTC